MSSPINKTVLNHLAELARIKLGQREEEKLLEDLQKILQYFEELELLDTSGIAPMNGGTQLKNMFREDTERENTNRGAGVGAFPETKDEFLKVPPVFGE